MRSNYHTPAIRDREDAIATTRDASSTPLRAGSPLPLRRAIVDLIFMTRVRLRCAETKHGGHYAHDSCCSKNENCTGNGEGFSAAARHGLHRILRRQRQAGGAFL